MRPTHAVLPAYPSGLDDLAPLLEGLPDPALLIDAEGRIAGSNAAARRADGSSRPRGLFLSSILRHPDLLEAVQAAVHDGATRTVEFETAAQVEQHTRCYVAPVTWDEARAALMVFHDQTARINTERMRADFLANASHELRTPLASLTLLIETLAGPARDDAAERDRFLKMMQVQADRMRRLIDDLLSLSRIELDEHVPPSDRADLAQVAREVADALAPVAKEREVQHSTASSPDGRYRWSASAFSSLRWSRTLSTTPSNIPRPGAMVDSRNRPSREPRGRDRPRPGDAGPRPAVSRC